MGSKVKRAIARDFVMARLAAARTCMQTAIEDIDVALMFFVEPDDDKAGKNRGIALESCDEKIGQAARGVQAAMAMIGDIDPKEGEPELDEDEDDDDEDDEDEEDDEEEDE